MDQDQIRAAYRAHLLQHNKPPASVYQLAHELGMPETEFYQFYPTLEAIDRDIWRSFIEQARLQAEATPEYRNYSVREKLLAFYFTLIELLRSERSYVILRTRRTPFYGRSTPVYLEDARRVFKEYVEELLIEGRLSKEVVRRAFLSERYPSGFWLQLLWLLNFWIEDNSPNFERTDEAIEKAVTLSFELIGHNALDSIAGFTRFLWRK